MQTDTISAANTRLFEAFRESQQHTGVTDEQVAEDLGLSLTEVQDVMAGNVDLTMSELRQLANTLGVLLSYDVVTSTPNVIPVPRLAATKEVAERLVRKHTADRLDDVEVAISARTTLTVTAGFVTGLLTELGRKGARTVIVRGASQEFIDLLSKHRHPSVRVTVISSS
ncbi:helix-turn-helix domain-containing protein [Agromyces sp. NPDC057679]|uniref:helix-turn-helix domain-containing protein n=1 Tax=Agromyces sp. NPDC057679 TaxID=3346207 RepID=UPI00366BF815